MSREHTAHAVGQDPADVRVVTDGAEAVSRNQEIVSERDGAPAAQGVGVGLARTSDTRFTGGLGQTTRRSRDRPAHA